MVRRRLCPATRAHRISPCFSIGGVAAWLGLVLSSLTPAAEPQQLRPPNGRGYKYDSISVSSDGSRIAARSNSETFVWETGSRRFVGTTRGTVSTLTPDTHLMLFNHGVKMVGEPKRPQQQFTAKIVDATTLQVTRTIEDLSPGIFSPDGSVFVEQGIRSAVILRDGANFERLAELMADVPAPAGLAAFISEGNRLLTWNHTGVYLWDVATQTVEQQLNDTWTRGRGKRELSVSSDGSFGVLLAAFSPVDAVELGIDVAQVDHFVVIDLGPKLRVRWSQRRRPSRVVASPDGRWIITGSPTLSQPDSLGEVQFDGNSELTVIDAAGGKTVHTVPIAKHRLTDMDIAADGTLVTCGSEGQVLVWNWNDIEAELPKQF